ncbi:hypothetical protein ACWEQ4_03845 [Rhodococcus sp. NPDC003994]
MVIDSVLDFYGDKPAPWLSELTHKEKPWHVTRGELPPGAFGNQTITTQFKYKYYDSLTST